MVQHWGVEDGLSQNTVMCMLQDKQGFMWFGTWNGLNRFDGYTFTHYQPTEPVHNSRIGVLYEDEEEQLWWQTYDNHYFRLDVNREHITPCGEWEIPEGMRQKILHKADTLLVDKRGVLWLADEKPGVLRYRFGHWKRFLPKQDIRFRGQAKRNFFLIEDKHGRTWVNPTGGGFGYYDYERDKFVCPLRSTSTIHSAYVDREGLLWISTYDKGVDCLDLEAQPFRVVDRSVWGKKNGEVRAMAVLKNGEVKMVEKDEQMIYCMVETADGELLYGSRWNGIQGGDYKLPRKGVYDLLVDGKRLYAATYGGGVAVLEGHKWVRTIGDGTNARCILVRGDTVWAGTTSGLLIADSNGERLVPSNDVRSLYYHNGLYVGTFGDGLLKWENDTLTRVEGSMPIVMGIAGLGDKIWMSSEEGITEMNLTTGAHCYYHVLEENRKAYFSEAKPIVRPDSVVVFGYSQGYVEFDPRQVRSADAVSVPLRILDWEYGQSLVVNYAALEYVNPELIDYAYYVEGVDKDWRNVGHSREARYEGLKHGRYTLHIRSTNRKGEWQDNEQILSFEVPQPLWTRWWMFMLYVLLLGGMLFAMAYASVQYTKMRQALKVESEVNAMKLQFFTNISHELRTPLTLISGPIEHILKTEKISSPVRAQLEIVQSNGQRMLRMVNQILDFRKVQNKKMRLRIQQVHLFDIINHTVANFNKEAEDRHIRLKIVQKTADDQVWLDREKVDTILYNLLSNAFKYTADGKAISVILDERTDFILMMVKDEGEGIPKDKRSVLFDRFTSHNEAAGDKPGTGIGLNLVKELVDLHHGFIEVDSEVGKGSTFTVMFRRGVEHFGNEVEMIVDDNSPSKVEATILDDIELVAQKRSTKKILVVDDNEDMRSFLIAILGSEYDVIAAKDGAEALKTIKSEMPDMVISDLMMPNMGGLEMTQRMKQQEELRYIPIVLLTAKSAIESKLEAMEFGADDYVTKPFEPEYLRARVRNILSQREQLERSYRDRLLKLEPIKTGDAAGEKDTFLARLLDLMEHQMDNNELTVDDLVEEMGIGRTVFFNHLKSLTGMNPVEFIREIRIKRAAHLLESGKYNVSEVTYMVGMNDSRYFSKCFKATYGMTPTEYKKKHEQQ